MDFFQKITPDDFAYSTPFTRVSFYCDFPSTFIWSLDFELAICFWPPLFSARYRKDVPSPYYLTLVTAIIPRAFKTYNLLND